MTFLRMINRAKNKIGNLSILHIMFILLLFGALLYVFFAEKQVESVTTVNNIRAEEGLSTHGKHFTMQGKNFTILSGAIHYFRVPTDYWDDRLIKLKGMGLNTVET